MTHKKKTFAALLAAGATMVLGGALMASPTIARADRDDHSYVRHYDRHDYRWSTEHHYYRSRGEHRGWYQVNAYGRRFDQNDYRRFHRDYRHDRDRDHDFDRH